MCSRWWAGVLLVAVVGPSLATAQSSCTETFPQAFAADPNQLSAIGAIALIPQLDNILPNPGYGVTLFAPSNDGVNSLLSTAGGAAALANLTSTLAAVILQNILPAPYSAQALVNQEGGVESLLGLYLNSTLRVVAKASGTNSSQVTVQGPVGAAVPILASFQVCASYLHVIDGALMPSESLASIPVVDPSNVNVPKLLSVPAPGAPSPPPIIYPPSPSPSPPPASGVIPVPVTATPAPAPTPTSASPTPTPTPASATPTPAPTTTPTPASTTPTPVATIASSPTASTTPTPTPTAATPAPAPSGAAAAPSASWAALACLLAAGLMFAS